MPTMTPGDNQALWREYRQTRTADVREALIARYVHLAKRAVDRLAFRENGCLSRDDLVSHAILGLIDAVERFDPEHGAKFETFATLRIRGAVADVLRSLDWVPRSVRRTQAAIGDAYARLEARLGRPAEDEEAAVELGIPLPEFHEALSDISQGAVFSLEESLQGTGEGENRITASDVVSGGPNPAALSERAERKRLLAEAIGRLPERERLVVGLYYYEDLTLKEIGRVLGVTEARACQLHARAMLRLNGRLQPMEAVLCGE